MMFPNRRHRREFPALTPRRRRRAFTLLETMLALALAGILLAGVYAAIDQSWKMTASGREEMERAQLARALIHKIELDIRSITFIPPPPVNDSATATTSTGSTSSTSTTSGSSGSGSGSGGSTGGGSGSGSGAGSGRSSGSGAGSGSGSSGRSSSGGGSGSNATSQASASGKSALGDAGATTGTSDSTTSTDTESTGPNSKSIGLRGTSIQLEISVSRPRRDLLPGTAVNATAGPTSDLREVTYSFVASTAAPIPGMMPTSGLVRTEGDRMAVEALESTGGAANQISNVQYLCPEVIGLNFRYFDGQVWSESWDSDATGRIPRAVELMVKLSPPKAKPALFNVATSRSMEIFRTVVLIPISDPFPKEFLE